MTFTSIDKNKFIEIDPPTIHFEDVPKKSCISSVRIRNIFSSNIVFKVKTTAPKAYVVKPNQAVLAPGESMEVQFCMNPTETYPSVQNSKDRFMIAATEVGTLSFGYNLNSIWAEKPTSSIQQNKLAANFTRAPAVVSTYENNLTMSQDNINKAVNYGQQQKSIQISDSISSISNSLNNSAALDELRKTRSNKGTYLIDQNTERNNHALTQKMTFNIDHETQSQQQYNPRNFENIPTYSAYGSQYNQANDRPMAKSFSGQSAGSGMGIDYKKEYEKLLTKVEEQEKQLLKASEERNRIFNELSSLKENLTKRKISAKSITSQETNAGGFQLLHLILVAVISLLLGALFSV